MNKSAWRAGELLLFGVILALAGGGGGGDGGESSGPFPKLSQPVSSKPDANGLVIQIRPLVARISDSDPLQIVLHQEGVKGPLTGSPAIPVNWADTCNTLTFHITTPDGKKRVLKTEPAKGPGYDGQLFASPTLFVKLTRKGASVTPFTWSSEWQEGPVPSLEATGTYRISATGDLMPGKSKIGKPIPFASGVVEINRGVEGYKPLDEIADIAKERVRKKLDANHEMGGQVYDDADNNRLVHLTGPSSQQWHFTILTVQVSPAGEVLNVFSREVSNCLAAGTKLQAESGGKPIEETRVGDRLWGYDLERGVRVLTTVRSVRRAGANETLQLDCGLRVTGEHPLYASGRWMQAKDLLETDTLLSSSGELVPVGKIERISGSVAVYDITVDEPHNFFASGVLVHNKSRPHWPKLDDAWYLFWSPEGK